MTLTKQFLQNCQELSQHLEREGILIRACADESLVFFNILERPEQIEIVNLFNNYLELVRQMISLGVSLNCNREFTARAFQFYDVSAPPAIKTLLKDPRRIVEFYSLSGKQYFRTFNNFEYSSYTIEDLYCRKWIDLYDRPKEMTELIFAKFQTIVQSENCSMTETVPNHVLMESRSLEHIKMTCDDLHLIPLSRGAKVVGVMSLPLCELL